MRTIVAGGLWT